MPLDRRHFLTLGAGAVGVACAARWGLGAEALAQTAPAGASAKACILLWMNGGPSHIDTWDPKPGKPTGGKHKAIQTSAPGMRISEHLPGLAAQAHRLALLRGVSTKEGNHQRAQHLVHTGYAPSPTVDHPSFGAWVSASSTGPERDLPAFVSLGGPSAGGGLLGLSHGPFVVAEPGSLPRNVTAPGNVDDPRLAARREALSMLEDDFARRTADPKVAARRDLYDKARRLMGSPDLAAFDVSSEPEAVRAAYGDSAFGRGCLTARRLVEAGVRFVEVVLDGWDTHKDGFTRTARLMGTLDPAMATLLRELAERQLLDSTLVAWMGEFGRTPRINGDEGRDHYPQAWSAVLAGGGVRGGVVHGATDDDGARVVSGQVGVADIHATMAHALGIDPARSATSPGGRPIAVTDNGSVIRAVLA
ncbi:MAG: DUF1501 domain-containing protein [Polyangiaceae bacterium]